MKDQLPVIDYELNELTNVLATSRCPTGAIVWLENDSQFSEGTKTPLPVGKVDTQDFDHQTYYQ